MTLTREPPRFDGAFDGDTIVCPVCNSVDWRQFPYEGIYCDDCNCEVELRPTSGDPGFVADFDAGACWQSVADDQRIPEYEGQRTGFAKYGGSSEGGYYRRYFTAHVDLLGDGEDSGDWLPAWARDADTTDDTAPA